MPLLYVMVLSQGLQVATEPRFNEERLRAALESGGRQAVHDMERNLHALGREIASAKTEPKRRALRLDPAAGWIVTDHPAVDLSLASGSYRFEVRPVHVADGDHLEGPRPGRRADRGGGGDPLVRPVRRAAGDRDAGGAVVTLSADELLQLYRLLDRLKSGLAAMD